MIPTISDRNTMNSVITFMAFDKGTSLCTEFNRVRENSMNSSRNSIVVDDFGYEFEEFLMQFDVF